jgi:hypothetical protein
MLVEDGKLAASAMVVVRVADVLSGCSSMWMSAMPGW